MKIQLRAAEGVHNSGDGRQRQGYPSHTTNISYFTEETKDMKKTIIATFLPPITRHGMGCDFQPLELFPDQLQNNSKRRKMRWFPLNRRKTLQLRETVIN